MISTEPSTEKIGNYFVFRGGLDDCIEIISNWIFHEKHFRWLACLNSHSFSVSLRTPFFEAALQDADILIADGIGIVIASKFLDSQPLQRITGSDVFLAVNGVLNQRGGVRVFFLGSTEETLSEIRRKMSIEYPSIHISGTYSPPFKKEYSQIDIDNIVAEINLAKPDVVWVGMTAPKQEVLIHALRGRINVKFVAAIGAVFDFYIGRINRAPLLFQRIGLEWLYRFIQEPRRLWRRTLFSGPVFVSYIIRNKYLKFIKPADPN